MNTPSQVAALVLFVCSFALLGCARPSSQAASASAPPPPAVEFVAQWGVHGQDAGQFDDPIGPAIDGDARVYFADRGTQFVQKFELRGTPLLSFQDLSARGASSVAVDSGGGIYVANAETGEIQVFFPEGQFLRLIHAAPQRDADGPFNFSVDAQGKIYVPDAAGSRIQVFSLAGKLIAAWKFPPDSSGALGHPVAAIAGADGFVYAGDGATGRVVKFSATGEQLTAWQDTAGSAPLLGLAVSGNHVIALRGASPRVEIWSTTGQPEVTDNLGDRLDAPSTGRLSLAAGMHGELLVLDSGLSRVLQFRIHLDPP